MTLSDLLIEHSAPTLAGIKCASLISLARLDSKESLPGKELREKGLSFMAIRTMKGKHLLLVYREKELRKALEDAKAKEILKQLGYDTSSLKASLNHLMERFQEESCPHEVGHPRQGSRGCRRLHQRWRKESNAIGIMEGL